MNDDMILVVAVDIEAKAEADFNLWYDQHVGDVLDCPGWLWGTRYRTTDGKPSYLALYGMASEEAMWTPERQAIKTFGRFWSNVESYWARIYTPIHHDHRGTPLRADGRKTDAEHCGLKAEEIISFVSVDVEAEAEAEFNRWYNDQHVREVLDCPGWRWGTRYKSTQGSPNYLAVYGMESEEAMSTEELRSIKGFAHLWNRLESYCGRTYKRIYHEAR